MLFLYVWIYVQIIIESLPVSSSGHVALAMNYLQSLKTNVPLWMVDFLLHGPTIVIVLLFFFRRWWNMLIPLPLDINSLLQQSFWKSVFKIMMFVGIADVITFVFWLYKFEIVLPLGIGFFITALTLYSLRYISNGTRLFQWNYSDAAYLGLVQGISLLAPGISRFATTYAAGCFLGYKRQDAFSLSFLIQFPLLIGAFLKGMVACKQYCFEIEKLLDFKVLFAILSATVLGYMMLLFVDTLIQKKRLWYLSWYMALPIMLLVIF